MSDLLAILLAPLARNPNIPIVTAPRAPDGFAFLTGTAGDLYLACRDPYASSYAVRVVSENQFTMARRVPTEALAVIVGAERGSVVWHLGLTDRPDRRFRIVVHRPFGPLLEF